MKLVLIPPGQFEMGTEQEEIEQLLKEAIQAGSWFKGRIPNEAPSHLVKITRPFYLGVHEVTEPEYERVAGNNPSQSKANGSPAPVEGVSWNDAAEFCRKLSNLPEERAAGRGYRLPTEAEWEYSCRAGTTTRYYFGDDKDRLEEYAWPGGSGSKHPVGQKKPNAWGLYDMHGNVWEWSADWHGKGYYARSPQDDPSGPASGTQRVFRGGSWGSGPDAARSAFRHSSAPNGRDPYIGFRVTIPIHVGKEG
jgi:formylglycine-generating enzyme required for sulfatase activity